MSPKTVEVTLSEELLNQLRNQYETKSHEEAIRHACYDLQLRDSTDGMESNTSDQNAVFVYHGVGSAHGDGYGRLLPTSRFQLDIQTLLADGYDLVGVPEVLETSVDEPKIALTFDDAHISFYENVLPIIERYDVPATVYVPTEAIGGDHSLSVDQLVELAGHDLVTIGNHTKSHPKLTEVENEATLRDEIVGARNDLEELLDIEVTEFCYPFYKFDDRSLAIVRESHEIAVTGPPGHPIIGPEMNISESTDPCLIPRVDGVTYSMFYTGSGIEQLNPPILRNR